ncbi:hypothetical protein H1P_2910010 [Hyella patelloides LEGE 07179]|uniref:Uncharacterized protein n=1 Tax=Hyella patelloides LEGE 07179 TaxID=945734 RepID=A0A563VTZ6_9CYAN|nr:hypothetical protein [Hyella patelloides]VEP14849.1 hypothetical protein H1P_2910010 [Hyella patelloides LEGE 07179]
MTDRVANNCDQEKTISLRQLKTMPQPQIGLLIKKLRQEMELTQEEFASDWSLD